MFIETQPMTAAERQRKCREGGKGRHRGAREPRMTREAMAALLQSLAAAEPEPQPAAPAETPALPFTISDMAA